MQHKRARRGRQRSESRTTLSALVARVAPAQAAAVSGSLPGIPTSQRAHRRATSLPWMSVSSRTAAEPATTEHPSDGESTAARLRMPRAVRRLGAWGMAAARRWTARRDPTLWLLVAITLLALLPRLYGLNWDANNHLHPDEREIVFKSMCLSFPGTPRVSNCDPAYSGPGWLVSPLSPLNPHFFAYGSLPIYLLAAVAHGLAWLTHATNGRFLPSDGGAWDDFNHFTLVGRVLSALFDTGSVLLAGLIARRLGGRWAGVLAAACVATTAFEVQTAHFYAVDTQLLFFVLLTLLACLHLAQGPRLNRTDDGADAVHRVVWSSWGAGLLVGAACGLALATKISALPLAAPMLVALALRWRRRSFDEALLAALGLVAAVIIVYLVVSPYTLIDWHTFQQQVSEQNALSRGQLDYPYVRQFADTTPFIYQLRQLLLYDMGLPLGLLGLAGFGWAVSRIWRSLADDWSIIVIWLVVYFAVVGSAYMKFSRYMLPVFAPLAICGACALVALAASGHRHVASLDAPRLPDDVPVEGASQHVSRRDSRFARAAALVAGNWGNGWARRASCVLGVGVLLCSTVLTLALTNIYSAPNTRVRASEWLYDHVPTGARLTNEVWDDPLPILTPAARTSNIGVAYTRAGHVIAPYQYPEVGLNLYDADTLDKAHTLAAQLANTDVVVLSSQRLLRSIAKLPDRYPMTTRYYRLLFSGELGFTLAAHFEDRPHLLGFNLDDTGADESYSVYDHPPVWIFTRVGAPLTAADLQNRLTNGLVLPATSNRSGAQKSLLLDPQSLQANSASPPLASQFPPQSMPNQVPLLWWLFVVELLGLISFPVAYAAFPGLHDRGWGLSKTLGLLVLAYAVWLPASLQLLPFDRWVVAAAFVLLAAIGAFLTWRRAPELWGFVRARWRMLAACELGFVGAFLAFAWVRAQDPSLWHIYRGGEKPMELAFLNAILRSRYLPPLDPWFSGGYINYYYYGQYLIAVLIKLTGITSTTAFNLAIPLLFALTFSGACSIVGGLTRRTWAGLAAGAGLVLLGNLDGLAQLLGQWHALLTQQPPALFDYWQSSRVIPYTINEFPYWSFLYADLHAHLIDLPIVLLLIGCCASLIVSGAQRATTRPSSPPDNRGLHTMDLATLATVAVALGAAWCTSTWDLPTYAALVVVALALSMLRIGAPGGWPSVRARLTWPVLRAYVVAIGATLGTTYLLYLPFHAHFQNFVSGIGTVNTPTSPALFVLLFALWLFLIVSFFAYELYGRWLPAADAFGLTSPALRFWVFALPAALLLSVAYLASLKSLLVFLLAIGIYLALDARHTPAKVMTYLLLIFGLALALGVEFIYVRDFLDGSSWQRMNTVFKFYYQVWTLFALGGTLAFAHLIAAMLPQRAPDVVADESAHLATVASARAWRAQRSLWHLLPDILSSLRTVWVLAVVTLVVASSVFVVEGTQARLRDSEIWAAVQPPPAGMQPTTPSLDGMAYMRGWYPGDYEAINWMNAHVSGAPTIVEASDGNYQWYGRVSIYTGLPSVLGWGSREYEQRYGDEVFPRQSDVRLFWSTPDPNAALTFLQQYAVRYIYVGALERTCYVSVNNACAPLSAPAQEKFATLAHAGLLRVVHHNADVVIYEVVQ